MRFLTNRGDESRAEPGSRPGAGKQPETRLTGDTSRRRGGAVGTAYGERLAQRVPGGLELGDELLVALGQRGDVVLQREDPAYPLQPDARRAERGDLAEQLDVAVGVAAPATAGAARRDQPEPLVGAQGLGVQAGELSGHADDVDSRVRSR